MINITYIIAIILVAMGLFYLFCEVFGTAQKKKMKTMQQVLKEPKRKKEDMFLKIIDMFAVPMASIFPFTKAQLQKMQQVLDSAKIPISAKLYLSRCIVKSLILCVVALASSIVIRPMVIVAIAIPLMVYVEETKKANKTTSSYRKAIEQELPNFVATIVAQLSSSRDIIRMMTDYSTTTNDIFKRELLITVADMESGNYETALNRFSGRINSPILNKVIYSLNGVVRGNNEIVYLKILGYDLKQLEISNMKKQAQKSIPKINACTMILLIAIIGLLMGVLLIDMVTASGVLF